MLRVYENLANISKIGYTNRMSTNTLNEILKLSPTERIQLVEDIWDSLAGAPEFIAITEAQKQELDYRLDNYRNDSKRGSSWADVKQRIRNAR